MAQFLIIVDAKSAHPNPTKDKFRWKKGDVVEVYDDSRTVGPLHDNSIFGIVQVDGMLLDDAYEYAVSRYEGEVDPDGQPAQSERSFWKIDIEDDNLSQSEKDKLKVKKEKLKINKNKLDKITKDKKTGETKENKDKNKIK